jgi:hypothetical protein
MKNWLDHGLAHDMAKAGGGFHGSVSLVRLPEKYPLSI